MPTLVNIIGYQSFSSEFAVLTFQTALVQEVPAAYDRTPFVVKVNINSRPVYEAKLYPDEKGQVVMYGLNETINSFLDGQQGVVNILADGRRMVLTHCYPSAVMVDLPAETFLQSHFVSRANGDLPTYPGSREIVTFADTAGTKTVGIGAMFLMADQKITWMTMMGSVDVPEDGAYASFEVDVDKVAARKPDAELIQFVVTIGQRTQNYRLMDDDTHGLHVVFSNSFGAPEHFYFPHVVKKTQPVVQSAKVGGRLVNYHTEPKKEYDAQCGMVCASSVDVFEDLLLSKSVVRQSDNLSLRVDSGEVVWVSSQFEIPTAKARLVEDSPLSIHHAAGIRTFDETFDETFA